VAGASSPSTTRTIALLAYLFERSILYREKLASAGLASAEAAGGLAEIAQLPLTEKRELRATLADCRATHLLLPAQGQAPAQLGHERSADDPSLERGVFW